VARTPPARRACVVTTVATRRLVDARRSEAARYRREEVTLAEPPPAGVEEGDDTLFLLFCCCHPALAPASQAALTLRAVGGLTTREIAEAFYVPEATMAQRISRAKRALPGYRLDQPGDLAVVLRVLYLVYTAGHTGRVDLAAEAIRLARQLTLATDEPEGRGLLALMLLNHARLHAPTRPTGRRSSPGTTTSSRSAPTRCTRTRRHIGPRRGGRPRARGRCGAPRDREAQRRARRPAPMACGPCLPLRARRRPSSRRRCVRGGSSPGHRRRRTRPPDPFRSPGTGRPPPLVGLRLTQDAVAGLETTTCEPAV
jgi:hypothetical protein